MQLKFYNSRAEKDIGVVYLTLERFVEVYLILERIHLRIRLDTKNLEFFRQID